MHKLFGTIIFAVALCIPQRSSAELQEDILIQLLGTLSAESTPMFRNGKLWGCTVEFNVLAKDWIYKQGAIIAVSGSFGITALAEKNKNLAVLLKVILSDLNPETLTFVPSAPPVSAYFISKNTTTVNYVIHKEKSDTPGGILVAFKPVPTFEVLLNGLSASNVRIAFARTEGGTDVPLNIDTSTNPQAIMTPDGKREHSPRNEIEFMECTEKLFESLK